MRDEEDSGMATPASPRLPDAPSRRDWHLPADEPGRDSLLLISADRPASVRSAAGDAAGLVAKEAMSKALQERRYLA